MEPKLAIAVIVVRYMILPGLGIGVVKAAAYLGLLPSDPLFHFVLMVQYTLPPAMNIGTPHLFIIIIATSYYNVLCEWMNETIYIYRYDDTTSWCGTRRVFSPISVDIYSCSICSHCLVYSFHVDLVILLNQHSHFGPCMFFDYTCHPAAWKAKATN